MAVTQFLAGLEWEQSIFSDFFVVGKGNEALYMCAYNNRNNGTKQTILETIKKNPKDFDFHHVIEQQHLADISWNGMLEHMYYFEIPTVLLHNQEHRLAYNAILHISQTRHLYMGKEIKSMGMAEKQMEAIKLYVSSEGRSQLKERTIEMKKLYAAVYDSDQTIKKIAMNILDHYLHAFN